MTLFTKKAFLYFLIVLLFSIFPVLVSANDDNLTLNQEAINPGSFYYSFKRLWEKGLEKLQFNRQSKVNFYQSQLKIRLSELNYVVENQLLSEVQQATERFSYTAGVLSDELMKEDKEKVVAEFEKYSKFLERLRDKYPANTSFWMLVQHDINTLKILLERIK